MKKTLIFSILLWSTCLLYANASTDVSASSQRGIAPYRLLLTNIQKIAVNETQILLSLNAINMGSKPLVFGPTATIPEKLILEFEESFNRSPLLPYKEEIKALLFVTELSVNPGKILKSIELAVENTKPLAEVNLGQKYNSSVFKKKKSKIRKKKPEVEETNEGTAVASNEEKAPSKLKRKLSKKRTVTQEEKEGVSFTNNVQLSEEDAFAGRECVDIVIDTVVLLQNKKNKWITIQYKITNRGNQEANIYGVSGNDKDNLALKVYLGSSAKLTRGALPLGGSFIHDGLDEGVLQPRQSFTGTIKLDIRKKTKFTSYLILYADPFNVMNECDKTNNKNYLYLE